jgi:hypothetical protein
MHSRLDGNPGFIKDRDINENFIQRFFQNLQVLCIAFAQPQNSNVRKYPERKVRLKDL